MCVCVCVPFEPVYQYDFMHAVSREEKAVYPDSRNFIHTTFDFCLQVGRDLYTVERSKARINKACIFIKFSWSVVHLCQEP